MLLNIEEFSKEFSNIVVAIVVDLFSGYDQLLLYIKDRDLTTFITYTFKVLRNTTVLIGATNLVA